MGPAAAVLALTVALIGCGDTVTSPAWVRAHPSTTLLTFDTTAPGVCAITVQYPNDAPAAISYLGSLYVQVHRAARAVPAGVPEVDHSGDWRIFGRAGGDLMLVTPTDTFDYRLESSC